MRGSSSEKPGASAKGRGSKRPGPRPRLPTLVGVAPAAPIVGPGSSRTPKQGAVGGDEPPRSASPPASRQPATRRAGGRISELRRFNRVPLEQPLLFAPKDDDAFAEGTAVDISLGGVFILTDTPAAFGAEITIHAHLYGLDGEVALPGTVRWTKSDGMGVQFGPLGAKVTLAITEIVRRYESSGD
jgi:hypothetical protein